MALADAITLRMATPDDFAALSEISAEARSRYRAIESLGYVADTPPVAEHRFHEGSTLVAVTPARAVLGFVLTRPLDGLLLVDNISTSSKCRRQGVGGRLLHTVFKEAMTARWPAVALTT